MWNVDETIHATVAEVLLDGGTLYRDAIDQRTPTDLLRYDGGFRRHRLKPDRAAYSDSIDDLRHRAGARSHRNFA